MNTETDISFFLYIRSDQIIPGMCPQSTPIDPFTTTPNLANYPNVVVLPRYLHAPCSTLLPNAHCVNRRAPHATAAGDTTDDDSGRHPHGRRNHKHTTYREYNGEGRSKRPNKASLIDDVRPQQQQHSARTITGPPAGPPPRRRRPPSSSWPASWPRSTRRRSRRRGPRARAPAPRLSRC